MSVGSTPAKPGALGAGGGPGTSTPLSPQVAETCQLAVRRLEWLQQHSGEPVAQGPYLSVDPAPSAEERDVGRLRVALLDEARPLFDRYRAMFALRDAGGEEAALALAEGEEGPRGAGSGPLGEAQWPHLSYGAAQRPRALASWGRYKTIQCIYNKRKRPLHTSTLSHLSLEITAANTVI